MAGAADNRTKRQRAGEFLVQGVRPITLAVEHGWPVRTLLHSAGATSRWARDLLDGHESAELSTELMRELGGKDEQELIAVVGLREDRPTGSRTGRICSPSSSTGPPRPATSARCPVGGRVRRARGDRHRARCRPVRPPGGAGQHRILVRDPGGAGAEPRDVLDWAAPRLSWSRPTSTGTRTSPHADLTGRPSSSSATRPAVCRGWREAAHRTVRIPIAGAASSLNAAAAGTVVLYEAARQRRCTSAGRPLAEPPAGRVLLIRRRRPSP